MATLLLAANTAKPGTVDGFFYVPVTLYLATAATGSFSWNPRLATGSNVVGATLVAVYASVLATQSSDRTDTITIAKWAQNATSGTAMLSTSGVLSSGNHASTTRRQVGTSGLTAFTSNVNPVISTTSGVADLAVTDTLIITNTHAGSNGSAGTVFNITAWVRCNVGDGVGAP